ncbi:aldo/keto reductase [Streptomyces sp. SID3212]|uniref:aldo/keto reductase n=1 Tax=Streptomyces sp. SID3212 TaxID=2690259 RepID=UPI00136836CC|nr:aldo/keto reductase [Streptomyces sp. SID3212]MYV53760.1 aldo/keto reductase [Streptomyces sp. SID3212]
MRYTTFGRRTGLRVSEVSLGAGTFGTRARVGTEPDEVRRILDRFDDAGGTFIDTSESYQAGESEEILGELLTGRRDRFTLATKFSGGSGSDRGVAATGNSLKNMRRAVEDSLRRLRTDHIDLLWVHFPDGVTPMEEILRGFDDLARQGKILHGGLSNFPAWRSAHAVALAEARGLAPIIGVQFEYSLVERTAEREILPMAEALGLGGALWSPLGGGLLTGKYRTSGEGRLRDWGRIVHTEDSRQKTAVVDAVLTVAKETGVRPARVAVAWVRERAERSVTPLVPVIGPRTLAQLEEYLGALDVRLDAEQYRRLDEASGVPLGQPHAVIAEQVPFVLGGDASRFRTPAVPLA